jgi:two-component system sensor histidine kinase VicK
MDQLKELSRKLALCEKKKKELEECIVEFKDFFENASMALHWADAEGKILWANKEELDLLGYSKEEYIDHLISDFHIDKFAISDILTRLKNGEVLHDYPARLKCKDGTIKDVLINSNVLTKNGKFIHTRCFTKDITELKKEEKRKTELLVSLEQNEARFKMLMKLIQLGTWQYYPLTGELIWSEECKKIYGLPPGEDLDFNVFTNHIHPEDKEFVLEEIQNAMDPAGTGIYDVQYRILRFDNSERWIRAQGKAYFNSEKRTERFIGTLIDITENKLNDEKIAKLAAIVESSDDAIVSKSLEGIVTSWNRAAEKMFGYTEDEMIGQPILKIIPEERKNEEPKILNLLRSGKKVDHFETQRMTKDRQLLDISLTISPIKDPQGNIIGISKIARDITDKKAEERRKNDFIAMVSHELKTPLTSMKSYLQVLLKRAKKDGDSFRINALTRSEYQVKKMVAMIEDFLNLARLEDAKIKLNKEVFDLYPLLQEVVEDAQLLVTEHTIKLRACHANVYADKNKIGQVVSNLLSNAIKYSPDGGNITINCEMIDEKLKISVSDEGIGISLKDQKKLFDRFYRVENEKFKTVSGFGVGLYLVSEILRYHNSKIEVNSKEGVGSTFFFTLDIKK